MCFPPQRWGQWLRKCYSVRRFPKSGPKPSCNVKRICKGVSAIWLKFPILNILYFLTCQGLYVDYEHKAKNREVLTMRRNMSNQTLFVWKSVFLTERCDSSNKPDLSFKTTVPICHSKPNCSSVTTCNCIISIEMTLLLIEVPPFFAVKSNLWRSLTN